jgi:excisionase family DNA binding protein
MRKYDDVMTLPEAAKELGLAPSTLRHQIKNGKLAARKVSRDWYLTREEVERYRASHLKAAIR